MSRTNSRMFNVLRTLIISVLYNKYVKRKSSIDIIVINIYDTETENIQFLGTYYIEKYKIDIYECFLNDTYV